MFGCGLRQLCVKVCTVDFADILEAAAKRDITAQRVALRLFRESRTDPLVVIIDEASQFCSPQPAKARMSMRPNARGDLFGGIQPEGHWGRIGPAPMPSPLHTKS